MHPSTAWLALPYSARGLGYELIRVCDADGRISCGSLTPQEAVARLCQVAPNNRKLMHSDFRALVADGFILVETTGEGDTARHSIVVRNFVEAQVERRAARGAAKASQGPSTLPPTTANDALITHRSMGVSARNHSIENDRLEEIRREEKRLSLPTLSHAPEEPKPSPPQEPESASEREQPTPPKETPKPAIEVELGGKVSTILDRYSGGTLTKLDLTPGQLYQLGMVARDLKENHGIDHTGWRALAEWIAPSGPGFKQSGLKSKPSWSLLLSKDGALMRNSLKDALDWSKNAGGYRAR